ncbi:MAG: hypothetical protein IKP20_02755 [Candidatus Methanomethylophilaceae archaeon]|jgi:hypothetical protein|nr:hypothetical protein [Candidatus Methanomethylophilaceae archaeon]
MMEGRPLKFRILERLYDGRSYWSYEIVPLIMEDYGMTTDYERDCVNFDMIEMATAGFIRTEKTELDSEGKFRKDRPVFLYSITDAGKKQFEWLVGNIGGDAK